MPRHTHLSLAICLTALLATSCVSLGDDAKFRQTRNVATPHQAGSALNIVTRNGSVTVERVDGSEVKIEAALRCTSQERLDATQILAERKDGTLCVSVAWADGRPANNEGCDFKVQVPDANGVEIQSGNGGISIADLSGKAVLHTSNGSIVVGKQNGDVIATTSNGRIAVSSPAGKVEARSSNGSIDIQGATAAVTAVTSNGSITAALTDDCPGPLKLSSSNSNVTLTLGKSFTGKLNASTSNGGVNLDQLPGATVLSTGRDSARLAFGDSAAVSEVTTSNGRIIIHAPKQ